MAKTEIVKWIYSNKRRPWCCPGTAQAVADITERTTFGIFFLLEKWSERKTQDRNSLVWWEEVSHIQRGGSRCWRKERQTNQDKFWSIFFLAWLGRFVHINNQLLTLDKCRCLNSKTIDHELLSVSLIQGTIHLIYWK